MSKVLSPAQLCLACCLLLAAGRMASATIRNVPGSYATIQDAIDASVNGDEVVIAAGTYYGRLSIVGKTLTVRGADRADLDTLPTVTLDGNAGGSVVTIDGGDVTLESLCLTNGNATNGGGLLTRNGTARLSNCTVHDNVGSGDGAGLYSNNASLEVSGCTIRDNSGVSRGGGIFCGGGEADIAGSLIYRNAAVGWGGGLYLRAATAELRGNTISQNHAGTLGGNLRIYDTTAAIRDCIVTMASNGGGVTADTSSIVTVRYSCVALNLDGNYVGLADPTGTIGNISESPRYASVSLSDFHLRSKGGRWDPRVRLWVRDEVNSPCLDAGDPAYPVDAEPDPNGNRRNMGAYGGTAHASKTANRPPTPPRLVELDPDEPRTTDDFVCLVKFGNDPDGDPITYQYQWAIMHPGEAWGPWQRGDGSRLLAMRTDRGDAVKVRVRSTDLPEELRAGVAKAGGWFEDRCSAWVETPPLVVLDTPPTAPTALPVGPLRPLAGQELTATPSGATDADEDPWVYRVQWRRSLDGGTTWEPWDLTGPVLAATTVKDERWQARACTVTDDATSDWRQSAVVRIGDTTPLPPTAVSITPGHPTDASDLRGNASGGTDADGDAIVYGYQWSRSTDGGATWSPWLYNGRTLPADLTHPGERWKVQARSQSGTPTRRGEWLQSAPVVIAAAAVRPLALSATASAHAGGLVQVHLCLSAEATVRVRLLNLAGREVAVVPEQVLAAGTQTVWWNGRSAAGTMAPAGQYVVSVVARSESGEASRALLPLRR